MKTSNFAGDREFCINYTESGIASLTSSIRKYTNKAIKLNNLRPNETKLYTNEDGSVYLQFPSEWIKFPSPPKTMTEENKIKASERMRKARKKKNEKEHK